MASPQLEDGYFSIANELYAAIARFGFSGRQRQVMDSIIMHTYQWHVKTAQLSVRQIGEETGIAYCHVSVVLNELIDMNVVTVEIKSPRIRIYGINKDYETWVKRGVHPNSYQDGNSYQSGNYDSYQSGNYDSYQSGNGVVTKVVTNTIERKSKKGERKRSPVFLGLWEMYPEDKRYGLQYISAEVEEEVVMHADAVKTALEIYVAQTDHKYLCKASKFFEERWKLVNPPAAAKDEEDDWQ